MDCTFRVALTFAPVWGLASVFYLLLGVHALQPLSARTARLMFLSGHGAVLSTHKADVDEFQTCFQTCSCCQTSRHHNSTDTATSVFERNLFRASMLYGDLHPGDMSDMIAVNAFIRRHIICHKLERLPHQ